jgi:hypothetical protein
MRAVWPFLVASSLLGTSVAHATPKECLAHHASGKDLRNKGSLVSAKDEFLKCADDACPKVVREECRELITKLAAETPSIVVVAKDSNGRDLTEGRVLLDGNPIDDALDGRSIELDPGPHALRFVPADGREVEIKFVARDGEKNRSVKVQLEPAPSVERPAPEAPPPAVESSNSPPVVAYVLAGVAAVAFGSFAVFALDGKSKKDDLDQCKPKCQQSDVDAMKKSFLIGDISLGIGALALGGSAYFFLSPGPADAEHGAARPPVYLGATGRF